MASKKQKKIIVDMGESVQRPLPLGSAKIPKGSKTRNFIVRAPAALIELLDQHLHWNGYSSRNDFVCEAIREKLNRIVHAKNNP